MKLTATQLDAIARIQAAARILADQVGTINHLAHAFDLPIRPLPFPPAVGFLLSDCEGALFEHERDAHAEQGRAGGDPVTDRRRPRPAVTVWPSIGGKVAA